MNNRNLMIGAAAFLLLGAFYLFSNNKRSKLDVSGGFEELVVGSLASDDIFGMHAFRGEGEGFRLAKRGDDWFVSSHFDAPANANKLRTLLGNLETASVELRSSSAEVLDDYALGEDGIHLVLSDESGGDLLHLIFGKASGSGGFLRREGSDDALRSDHNFLSDFGVWGEELSDPDHSSWMDLVAFKAERDDVQSIDMQWDGQRIQMSKEFEEPADAAAGDAESADELAAPTPPSYEWRVGGSGGFLAKKTVADGILGSLSSVRARDAVGPLDPSHGLGDDADRVTVTLADGATHELRFGNALEGADDQLYFQVAGEDLVWALPNYLKTNIFKDPESLQPE